MARTQLADVDADVVADRTDWDLRGSCDISAGYGKVAHHALAVVAVITGELGNIGVRFILPGLKSNAWRTLYHSQYVVVNGDVRYILIPGVGYGYVVTNMSSRADAGSVHIFR